MDNIKKPISSRTNTTETPQNPTKPSLFLFLKNKAGITTKSEVKPVEEIKVTAERFASKIKDLDKVSDVSSSARMKLMEMRFSKNSKSMTENDFTKMMKDKPFSINIVNALGEKIYIFSPDKIVSGIESTDFIDKRKHSITDNFTSKPLRLQKIGDLQQFLEINPTGFFDENTFKALLGKYEKSLFIGEIEILNTLEKLMMTLLQKIGLEEKYGKYIKGLLIAKTIIIASEEGKFGNFEKMNTMLEEYLPDLLKTKLRIRLRLIKKIYSAVNGNMTREKSVKLHILIKEEMNNLSVKDKIKILDCYSKIFAHLNDSDVHNQIVVIKSMIGFHVTESDRKIVINNINLSIKYLKKTGHNDEVEEVEGLYNRIKLHALSQII